ncbi:ArsR/SmtB family transcription factor [Chengkuizengella axinellae]|uniref:Metalloregulator ArsR/SmtB family transcription factor n=1 Tax=Chengkuizengella axinellae TaxID=3064388 RepID=A0ABT9IUT7_9BACL|nr:metalloregulator ArsR/SmtB family transcription factor [Chengkuizengella sp. 2205SS18-9]MDP5272595.1 metalloregulator ArsR/SmtB family transcription factor [Chengkuizengella sp. 2205SS18-9]
MEFNEFQNTADMLKVIGHPVRLCIVMGLLKKGNCNVSFMENCMNLPQSSVSTHLQKLRTAGIIVGQRKGLEVSYRLKDEQMKNFVQQVSTLLEPTITENLFDKELIHK